MHDDTWSGMYTTTTVEGPNHPVYPVNVFSANPTLAHVDYEMANWYSSTRAQNRFTQIPICSKRTTTGFLTLADREFKETKHGDTIRSKTIASRDELIELLRTTFELEPPTLTGTAVTSSTNQH
ncbi:hypothetical protein H257_04883 [Aphanomyces astaci]|uniref:Uncharacterized protein n=1 Tax=Aphanomyces astaci TaxID=112090 RepID=W4GS65_APHAT|nr:hypothetical protein H257_04883 [Aphanomyces astaci]ETV82171.1 hypothetical protein H257_04883 [Aphanomyces astaci]|eukprot:XP_009827840.1 hypothetical protein H257_04883 [Aphanomyces astaci]